MTASTSTDPGAPVTAPDALALVPMRNRIQDYDWGSTSALALLQGRTPDGGPEAELWMGAHPAAPSDLLVADGRQIPLPEAVGHFPEAVLGQATLNRFGRFRCRYTRTPSEPPRPFARRAAPRTSTPSTNPK